MIYSLLYRLIIPLFIFRVKEVGGMENLPENGPYLVAANHVSFLDPPIISSLVLKKTKKITSFITHAEVYRHFGNYFGGKLMGMIPIDKKDKNKCLQDSLAVLDQKGIIAVFPEGSRNPAPELLKGKTGIARLALWSKCPVIPVGVCALSDNSPWEAVKLFFSRRNVIKVEIGPTVDLSAYYNRPITRELLDETTKIIMGEISRLCGKKCEY